MLKLKMNFNEKANTTYICNMKNHKGIEAVTYELCDIHKQVQYAD